MANYKRQVTISDVAEMAGVSKATVSHFINERYDYMSNETRLRIKAVIEETNFRPNTIARSLKLKHTKLIGIIMHNLEHQGKMLLVSGICDALNEAGYSPLIFNSYNDSTIEKQNIATCIEHQVDGIIFSPCSADFDYYNKICEDSSIPFTLVNRYVDEWHYDAAYIDHYNIVMSALNQLYDNGFDQIAFLTSNKSLISTKKRREEAFEDFVEEKLHGNSFGIIRLPSHEGNILPLLKDEVQFFRNKVEGRKALFAVDADMLYWTVTAVQELGVSIPNEMGLCGYDDLNWGALTTPSITTITQPLWELGSAAGRTLVKRLSGRLSAEPQISRIEGILTIRASTKA